MKLRTACWNTLDRVFRRRRACWTVIIGGLLLGTATAETKPGHEGKPAPKESHVASYLEPLTAISGVDSRLRPGQHARVVDSGNWRQLWLAHTGSLRASGPAECPKIEFSSQMVIAIVEPGSSKRATLSFESFFETHDGAELIYLNAPSKSSKRKCTESQFAFFVVPRSEKPLRIRRLTARGQEGEIVASFPTLDSTDVARISTGHGSGRLNIGFAFDPGNGKYNGVVGTANEVWNFVDVGTTAIDHTRHANGSFSDTRLRISPTDGKWGIAGRSGVYHGYIYHNCRCTDLKTQLFEMPPGQYQVHVLAHGDAPHQNARVEVKVNDDSWGTKSTANDGTWAYRETPYREGVHYVSFEVEIESGDALNIISHRDGSDYSMFNAIQVVPIGSSPTPRTNRSHSDGQISGDANATPVP